MTPKQKYNRDGYVVLSSVIDETKLRNIWMNIHFLVSKQIERFGLQNTANMHKNLRTVFDMDINTYISTLIACSRTLPLYELFVNCVPAIIMDIMSTPIPVPIFAGLPIVHIMAENLRIPDGYFGTSPHQDWSSTQGSLDVVTVWIPVTNAGQGNFPLEVIPGSHENGLLPGMVSGSVLETNKNCYDESQFVPVDANFGDIVLMSGFTVHRTGMGSNGMRMAISARYDNCCEPEFVKRGYPSSQKRSSSYVPITDNFPTEEQVRKVFCNAVD